MKITELWNDDVFRAFFNAEKLVGLFISYHSDRSCRPICPFCNNWDLEGPFQVDFTTGAYFCPGCRASGGIVELLAQILYRGSQPSAYVRGKIAYDYGIYPNVPRGLYKHFRGKEYFVEGVARDQNRDGRWVVFYRALHGDYGLFGRELHDFFASTDNGQRFQFVKPI